MERYLHGFKRTLNRVAFSNNILKIILMLISNPIFLDQNLSNPYLSFDISYSLKSKLDEDALLVEVSRLWEIIFRYNLL